jgi:AcrR family transcriptional regulator
MAIRKRDHLVAVAQKMFCDAGFHAVGVDAILQDAGVARMTLYKNFGSKEELILATLKREDIMFRQWLVSSVEARSQQPEDRILAIFPALEERFGAEGYQACAFIRASIEYPAPDHPIHRAARAQREMIRSYLRGLASGVEGADPITLSEQLYLLIEGVLTASQLHGETWPAQCARKAAEELLSACSARAREASKQTKRVRGKKVGRRLA